MRELNILFPDKSIDIVREILADSGGDKSLAASRLVQWPTCASLQGEQCQMGFSNSTLCNDLRPHFLESKFRNCGII